MAFNDLEYHTVKKEVGQFVESIRPPKDVRPNQDYTFHISGQTVELDELRSAWQGQPGEKTVIEIAKISYVRSQKAWKLYWMRGNLKWALYGETPTLKDALEIIRADEFGCFLG